MINEDRVPEKALDELVGLWKVRNAIFTQNVFLPIILINAIFVGRNSR